MTRGGGDSEGKFDRRIERANQLAAALPFAAEGLRFYERLAGFQKSLYVALRQASGSAKVARPPGSLRDELDLGFLLPWFGPHLALVAEIAPAPLAQAAAELAGATGSTGAGGADGTSWEGLLVELWRADPETGSTLPAPAALIAWTFLQGYAEYLADHTEQPAAEALGGSTPYLCPACSGRPLVGVLRPLGDGGKRSLICSLCATEWEFRRIVCPACGEESVDKLPVFVAEEVPHVRVEACDTCHYFIKTIDLTTDGRAVPVVDELAAIPLSLWAAERQYTKLAPNLLGL
jgi:formate dehydrogenase accessory protein FdhE